MPPVSAVDHRARGDELLDHRNEGVSIPLIEQHCETIANVVIDAADDLAMP